MKITKVPIDDIKVTLQIRTNFNKDTLEELKENIKENGLLQPIIVDKNNFIISGERRYRAYKELGNTEIDCIVKDVNELDRLLIQVSENIQRDELRGYDAAKAMERIYVLYAKQNDIKEYACSNGVTWISNKLGKSKSWVSQLLTLLEEDKEVTKALESKDKMPYTYILAANAAPEQYQDALKHKLLDKTIDGIATIKKVANALKSSNTKQAENLMLVNYTILEPSEISETIHTIMSDKTIKVSDDSEFHAVLVTEIAFRKCLTELDMSCLSPENLKKFIEVANNIKNILDNCTKIAEEKLT